MIKRLSELNGIDIKSVKDSSFKTFGNVIEGLEVSTLVSYMEEYTQVPEVGNVYIPSVPEMEILSICQDIKENVYGGLDIQIGYCNGRNSTYNGFEYHKCSEITVAVTDFMMVLGHTWDMENNTYNVEQAEVFFVEKGTVIELFQTTLHLSPCKVREDGFKAVIVLAKGTNDTEYKNTNHIIEEDKILLFKNKWIIAHKDREPLVKAGAYIGLIGENKELKF